MFIHKDGEKTRGRKGKREVKEGSVKWGRKERANDVANVLFIMNSIKPLQTFYIQRIWGAFIFVHPIIPCSTNLEQRP